MRQARWAVLAAFCLHGAIFSSWVPLIPVVQQKLGLTAGQLGVALLGTAIGTLVPMPFIGRLIGRFGSHRVFAISGVGYCAALSLPVMATNLPTLFLALVLFGLCGGSSDVAMNAQGVVVEGRYGRPLMSSFHGVWSLGSLGGAAVGSILAALNAALLLRTLIPAVVVAVGMILAARAMLPPDSREETAGGTFVRLPRQLVGLGIVAFCALMAEGAIGDWSAVYLRRVVGVTPALAASGYATFTATMTLGRLTGDWITACLDSVLLVRIGGALLAGGLCIILIIAHLEISLLGFALMGLALANVLPIVYSAAGRVRQYAPGMAIAAVTTTGYLGYLVGPPLIGFTADRLTLRGGLSIAAILGVIIVVLANVVRGDQPNYTGQNSSIIQ